MGGGFDGIGSDPGHGSTNHDHIRLGQNGSVGRAGDSGVDGAEATGLFETLGIAAQAQDAPGQVILLQRQPDRAPDQADSDDRHRTEAAILVRWKRTHRLAPIAHGGTTHTNPGL